VRTDLKAQLGVRLMCRGDLPHVCAIERAETARPWLEADFLHHLRRIDSSECCSVLLRGVVVGYMVYEVRPEALSLVRLAVHPAYRRRGIGSHLVDRLFVRCGTHRRSRIAVVVHEEHLSAQQFLRACGFLAVEFEREYRVGVNVIRFEGRA